MKSISIRGQSTLEIKAALGESMLDGFKPTLAFAFVSLVKEWEPIRDLLDLKGIATFGAITAAAFDSQTVENDGIVIMLLDMNPKYFKIVFEDNKMSSLGESVKKIGSTAVKSFSRPALLISVSNIRNSGDEIMNEFIKEVGNDITIMGGYSGETETWEGLVFTNGLSSSDGIIALIIDLDKVDVKGVAVSGWRAFGTEKTVTQSNGQWMMTIDDEPATDIFKKFIGDPSLEKTSSESVIKLDTTAYVLQSKRDGDSPIYFAALEFNSENNSIRNSKPMEVGSKFRFSLPPDFEVIDTVIETSKLLKEKELPDADALIIFSCIGRYTTLGPLAIEEVSGLAQTWGKPTAGFFSLGEFGRVDGGRPEYHGTTCSWVALKEI